MTIGSLHTDEAILTELGERIARSRIDRQLTQAVMAEQAGVSKRTVERIEAGASTQLASVLRVLRVLGLLEGLNKLIPEPGPRPMDLLKLKGKTRQRVSSAHIVRESKAPWTWGNDT
jgi:transcriptional regulator with XRE-family HTH domain